MRHQSPLFAPTDDIPAAGGIIDRLKAALGIQPEPEPVAVNPLQESLDTLQAAHDDLKGISAAAVAENEATKASLAAAEATVAAQAATLAAINAVIPGLSSAESPAAAITEAATRQSAEQVAAMGMPAETVPAIAPAGADIKETVLTRAAFDDLEIPAQNAHMRAGGKLKD